MSCIIIALHGCNVFVKIAKKIGKSVIFKGNMFECLEIQWKNIYQMTHMPVSVFVTSYISKDFIHYVRNNPLISNMSKKMFVVIKMITFSCLYI